MTDTLTPTALDCRVLWAQPVAGRESDDTSLAGAWWPRTGNSLAELSQLLPVVSEHLGGRISRVSLNIDAWDAGEPTRLSLADGQVRLGWFHTLNAATVTLGRGTYDRVTLVVIPPTIGAREGDELLRQLAETATWPSTADGVLAVGG